MSKSLAIFLLCLSALQDAGDAAKAQQARINELRKILVNSSDEQVRLKAIAELGGLFDEDARAALVNKTTSDTEAVRLAAAKALIKHRKPVCAQALGNAIQAHAKSDKMSKAFIGSLSDLDMCASIPVLLTVLESRYPLGNESLDALTKIGCFEAVQPLVNFLKKAETEEKKPDFFDNVQYTTGKGQPPQRPQGPDKIENKTKIKPLAALAPKVRETLKALTGKSFDAHREWAAAAPGLAPRLGSLYLCEATRQTYEIAPGKPKKCPHNVDSKSDHDDTFLKHIRE